MQSQIATKEVKTTKDGEATVVIAFGLNEDGQCGSMDDDYCSPRLTHFPVNVIITAISAGSRHSLALSSMGRVYSWGWGLLGQLGLGSAASFSCSVDSPTLIQSLSSIECISAGGIHSGCLNSEGHCYMWGSSNYGQLGLGNDVVSLNSICVPTLITRVNAFPSASSMSALDRQRSASPEFSPLVYIDEESVTAVVEPEVKFAKLSCGGMHTAAVSVDGRVYCWGRADSGQTGYADWHNNSFPGLARPTALSGVSEPVADVACGSFHTLILTTTGRVYTIGKDDFGVLGIGRDEYSSMRSGNDRPTIIPQFNDSCRISSIAAGGWHSCFLSEDGRLFICGKGEYGRLGTSNEASVDVPVEIFLTSSAAKAEGGLTKSLRGALSSSLSSSPPTSDITDKVTLAKLIQAGGSHTVFVDTDNQFYAVGRSDDGRLGINPKSLPNDKNKNRLVNAKQIDIASSILKIYPSAVVTNIEDIKAGGSHSLVLAKIAVSN